jgi:hypothetical protein
MPTILITGDDGIQRVAALPDRSLRIGRAPDNDIVLPEPNKGVSREHAELRIESGHYILVDLQSQNGTWINGERVERARVPANAEIAIGLYRLRLQTAPSTIVAAVPTSDIPDVADMPLYRPERAAGPGSMVGRSFPAEGPPTRTGVSKGILLGGGVAIGIVVILIGRMMAPPAASSASTPHPAAPSPSAAPVPPPPAASPAAPAKHTETSAVPAEPSPKPAEAVPSASAPPPHDKSERSSQPIVLPAAKAAAREAFNAGSKLDAEGDWMGALRKYEEAQRADATLPGLDRAVKAVGAKLRTAGGDALNRARQYDAIGLSDDALKEYEKAAQWLPPDDPNRQIARSRADQLRNGAKGR